MKIGLSYSRCIRDIIDGNVDANDVLVIITRTQFNPANDEQWAGIWHGYTGYSPWSIPEWSSYGPEDEVRFRELTQQLYDAGKIHQPRYFGADPVRRPEIWLEAVLPSSELENNPAAKAAWNKFQNIAGLTNVELDDKYQ